MTKTTVIVCVGGFAIGVVLALLFANSAGAAQRALTISSLKSACADKVAVLDKQIALHNVTRVTPPKTKVAGRTIELLTAAQGIAKAEEDKKIVLVACELLEGALK